MKSECRSKIAQRNSPPLYMSGAGSVESHSCEVGLNRAGIPAMATLVFVHNGVGAVFVRGCEQYLDANQVLLFGGGRFRMRHLGCAGDSCATTITLSSVATSLVAAKRQIAEAEIQRIFSDRLVMREPRIQRKIHLLIHSATARRPEEIGAVDEQLIDLFGDFVALFSSKNVIEPFRRQSLRRVRLSLATRLEEPPTLNELASIAGCTRFHLCRIFKEETGLTIRQYIHRLRLDEAVSQLCAGQSDLSTLAIQLGYASHSHFTSRFQRLYGITPSALRQQVKLMRGGARAEPARQGTIHG